MRAALCAARAPLRAATTVATALDYAMLALLFMPFSPACRHYVHAAFFFLICFCRHAMLALRAHAIGAPFTLLIAALMRHDADMPMLSLITLMFDAAADDYLPRYAAEMLPQRFRH